jgi:molybdopterin molybdotransferase
MKPVDLHLADVLRVVRPLEPLELELERLLETVLAEDVTAPVPLPPFDNSAMDGYAVRADDVRAASEGAPVSCRWTGTSRPATASGTRSAPARSPAS